MTEGKSGDSDSGVECPTCGRDDFASVHGMKTHHGHAHDESIAGMVVECSWCGEEMRKRRDYVETYDRHFCDRECMGEWRSDNVQGENHPNWSRVVVRCTYCNKKKQVVPYNADTHDRHFCDRECMGEWRSENRRGENHPIWGRVTVVCDYCGGEKVVPQSYADRNNRHFCDTECMKKGWSGEGHPQWNGGSYPYGEGWTRSKREAVRASQNRVCAGCGTHEDDLPRRLDVHHIEKARTLDDPEERNALDNLIGLCRECHAQWERMTPLRPQTTKEVTAND